MHIIRASMCGILICQFYIQSHIVMNMWTRELGFKQFPVLKVGVGVGKGGMVYQY
jgi:hypothetical protein